MIVKIFALSLDQDLISVHAVIPIWGQTVFAYQGTLKMVPIAQQLTNVWMEPMTAKKLV
jgi:hypothetical protein